MAARDYKASSPGPDLSDKQLRDVAKTLGQEWEQAALHLGLKKEDLDEIKKEKREFMQRRNMLRLWKDRRPGKATAQDLLRGLEDMKDLPDETCRLLEARDYEASSPGPDLSDKQLRDVANTLGQEWEQVGLHLGLKNEDLDEFKNVKKVEYMQRRNMLRLWKDQRPGKATVQDLLRGLEDMKDLPDETRRLLEARDYKASSPGPYLSDKQLQDVAKTLGQEWEQAALHLGLKNEDLDEIKKEKKDEYMQRRNMLRLWKDRRPGKATAQDLLRGLEDMKDLPDETRRLLEDLLSKVERCHIGTSLTEDTASMSLMDRYEEEDGSDSDASAEIDEDDEEDEEEMHFKSHCEKCKASQQSPEYEKVTPTKISKWSFQVQLEGEGTYECSATGLVFEVSEQALVRYSVLSWFQFSEFLQDSWRPAGSVYDVDVVNKDSSVLKFIHFPHSLCLAEPMRDLSFSVLHVKERHADIESTVGFTASHVKWRVSSLSLLGPIQSSFWSIYLWMVEHHAMVLIYKEQNKKDPIFQVYLGLNSDSEIKAIEEQMNKYRKKCIRIYKPANCTLVSRKYYHLKSEPEGKIEPSKIIFTTEVLAEKVFSEAHFGEHPPVRLFLMASAEENIRNCLPLWSATITEVDWNDEAFSSGTFRRANIRQRAAAEGTSDLRSSPSLSLEHRLGACSISGAPPSSTRSSTPATSSESQPAGQATSSTTSSPPAPSRATQAAGHPTSSTTSSPPAPSRATQAAGHPTSSTTSSPPAPSRATQAAGHPTSSTTSRPPAPSRATQAAGHPTSSTTSRPPAPSRATQAAGHPTSSTTSRPPAPSRATQAEGELRELRRIRSEFVQRVSIPVIKGLLDDLWQQELLSTEDKDFVMEKGKIKTDMARCLIDMVIGKGEKASKEMIDSMKKRDNPLCITLGLISSPTASGAQF
ncbi:uncharacterized protein LOC132473960 [Gadus macrocephalus]|uniref:uncharacterized protein LOC132473960 n=1 Tax=Gadus macrocephalus TaxID=80720 RepID=UPI0028CB1BC4|nr:uncharacterized protein LOC132473960 [Gadus macrocephalus]